MTKSQFVLRYTLRVDFDCLVISNSKKQTPRLHFISWDLVLGFWDFV